jgi:hypothetical protein
MVEPGRQPLPLLPDCANCGGSGWIVRLEGLMADHGEVAYTTADGNDYVAHEQTYLGFLTLVKWGTISIIVLLVLMAIFLT